MLDIASGAFDYNTVLRRTVKEMGLPQQRERVTVDGLGNIGVGRFTIQSKPRIIQVGKTFMDANPVRLPDGTVSRLVEGTEITDIEVFAGKGSGKELRVREFLVQNYGGKAENWQHTKGRGYVELPDGAKKLCCIGLKRTA